MWRWLATGLLLAGAARAGAADGSAWFAPALPESVGDVSRWEIETGQFESQTERGDYRLYVNPQRLAMYQLMRYRVELLVATSPEEQRRGGAERVVFIRRPGVREPMVCWERLPGEVTAWRVLSASTAEYQLEMNVLMRVLAAHRAVQASSSPDR
jgi:hypothetical protein